MRGAFRSRERGQPLPAASWAAPCDHPALVRSTGVVPWQEALAAVPAAPGARRERTVGRMAQRPAYPRPPAAEWTQQNWKLECLP